MLKRQIFSYYPILANGSRCPGEGIMTTVMVVEDDPAFLNRFCKIVASDIELELFAAVADVASARQAMSKAAPDVLLTDLGLPTAVAST
jgi:CheY-like chemotaxis protein